MDLTNRDMVKKVLSGIKDDYDIIQLTPENILSIAMHRGKGQLNPKIVIEEINALKFDSFQQNKKTSNLK